MLKFNLDKVIPKLKEEIKLYKEFFIDTHKSFYCGMCDAEFHKYIDLLEKKVQYSKGFCRKLVQRNYTIQSYFGVHLVKYLNIAMNFLNQCTYDGRFMDLELSPNQELLISHDRYVALNNCRRNKNSKRWFLNCRGLCEKFKYQEFDSFYTPNFQKLTMFVRFANKKLKKIKKYTEMFLFSDSDNLLKNKKKKTKRREEYVDSTETEDDEN